MIISMNLGEKSYDIVLQKGAINNVKEYLSFPENRKVLVVTDSGVPQKYVKAVADSFKNSSVFVFPQGEENKNFETYKDICQALMDNSFTRKDAVIAVGGGVTGDMAGFAAATYMRGIDFYNIPTTLLSQVDSSIGGKTAIDLGSIKNIIGAFHQPKKVIIDPDVLSTLPKRHIRNGLAESIKMGITNNEELFAIFEEDDFISKIEKIIELSLMVKKSVVEQDEKEQSLRKVLNFGHTIGHGIEAVYQSELYHGECVALGMIAMCGDGIKGRVISALKNVGLPTEFSYNKQEIYEALCHDKKGQGGSISVVRSNKIGEFEFCEMKNEELLLLI